MCITFILTSRGTPELKYRLIVAFNRDEVLQRRTRLASWSDGVLAGTDDTPGKMPGTWLGMDHRGRVGLLTNISTEFLSESSVGRGGIVPNYLRSSLSSQQYLDRLSKEDVAYNPFNVCLLEPDKDGIYSMWTYSRGKAGHSVKSTIPKLVPGEYHGLSNSPMHCPFLKTTAGLKKFKSIVDSLNVEGNEKQLEEALFNLLSDKQDYGQDPQMQLQGTYIEGKSSIFVDLPNYGTRTQTLILVTGDGLATFIERTRTSREDTNWTRRDFQFTLKQ